MPATVGGEVAGVSYTLYENGMLKVGTTGNRMTLKLKKGSDVEAAVRKAAAEAGLLEALGCGPEELPRATEERDAAAP